MSNSNIGATKPDGHNQNGENTMTSLNFYIDGEYAPEPVLNRITRQAPEGAAFAFVVSVARDEYDVLYYEDEDASIDDDGQNAIKRITVVHNGTCEHTLDAYGDATADETIDVGYLALLSAIVDLRQADPESWECDHTPSNVADDIWSSARRDATP